MYDIITESPFYKSVIAKGLEQGREQGRERGLKEGREQGLEEGLTALRQAIVDIVHERLPSLVQFAELQVATIDDPTRLRRIIVRLITISDAEQAIQVLLDVKQEQ